MSERNLTLDEYRNSVEIMAEEAIIAEEEYDQAIQDAVFQEVDSAHCIIYYSYNTDVLDHAKNEPEEWNIHVTEDSSWKEVIQAMAFSALRMDVYEEVQRQKGE